MKDNRTNSPLIAASLLLLCGASVSAVGFSAWRLLSLREVDGNVSVNVDDVVDINSYITYGTDAEVFNFCKDGVIDDGQIISSGDIVINFKIDLEDTADKISNHLEGSSTSFKLVTTFSHDYSDFDSLLGTYLKTVSMGVDASEVADFRMTPNYSETASTSYKSNFDISTGLEGSILNFKVKYSFSFPTSTFNTDVYSKLSDDRLVFSFKAEVEL